MKKIIPIVIIIVVILLAAGFVIWYKYPTLIPFLKPRQDEMTRIKKVAPLPVGQYTRMSGNVSQVTNNSIFLNGTVLSMGSGPSIENKTIEFAITPETVLMKTTIKIPSRTDKNQNPTVKQETGSISDLKANMNIRLIDSSVNLSSISTAPAKVIEYDVLIPPTK